MSASSLPHGLPVHPHQLEVQEFDSYDLIVDLRSGEAYGIDHIPRAVSVPWSPGADSTSLTRTGTETGPSGPVAMEAPPGLPYAMESRLSSLSAGDAVLLYCDQGGAMSSALAPLLAARGLTADVLPGGWASYRRWVGTGIEVLARSLDWHWVRSLPGGVSQALVSALAARGEQVLEIGAQFDDVVAPGLIASAVCRRAPALDSRLVDGLRRLDPGMRVWVDQVLALAGDQVLPTPLHEALRGAMQWRIDASIACRAEMLQAWLREYSKSVTSFVDAIAPALTGSFASSLHDVRDLERRGDEHECLAALLRDVLDPIHELAAVPGGGGRERVMQLPSGTAAAVHRLAEQMAGLQISP